MAEKSTAREAKRQPSQNGRAKRELSLEAVRRVVRYRPTDGTLVWRKREPEQFPQARRPEVAAKRFNTMYAGKEALAYVDPEGVKKGALLGRQAKAAQVCWLLIHGQWPEKNVSHKNGDRVDNRASNLELAERGKYQRGVRSDSKLGVSGVSAVMRGGAERFRARLKIDGRLQTLGVFETVAEASRAVKQAKAEQKARKAPKAARTGPRKRSGG